jgi:prepilin peptidase CpaA
MTFFTPQNWPLLFICAAMIVAAVIDGWKLKVPNWLTYPLILSGWLFGALNDWGVTTSGATGGFWGALAGTALGFAFLLPVYAIGGMGAGDVKMQMGFGAWVGAFFGFGTWASEGQPAQPGVLGIVWWSFAVAVLIGGVIAAIMIVVKGQYRQNLQNTRDILGDLLKSKGNIGDVAAKAGHRKPRMHLLPYGIPLCIGFVGYLVFLSWAGS